MQRGLHCSGLLPTAAVDRIVDEEHVQVRSCCCSTSYCSASPLTPACRSLPFCFSVAVVVAVSSCPSSSSAATTAFLGPGCGGGRLTVLAVVVVAEATLEQRDWFVHNCYSASPRDKAPRAAKCSLLLLQVLLLQALMLQVLMLMLTMLMP
jgi:hypothetical protein